ncbi:MAG: alanine racemase [Marvinbryantia sp.]|jgi:alanine racemase
MYSRIYAEINLDAVAENFAAMKKNIDPKTKIMAVLKADGYGHGAVPIAHLIESYDYIWGFATATAEEALQLRAAGIQKPILVLGFVFAEHYAQMVEKDIRIVVFKRDMAEQLNVEAVRQGKKAVIHFGLDTGMTRIGFADTEENIEVIRQICCLSNIEAEGIFTHFARADETDRTATARQLARFEKFIEMLKENSVRLPICHCSNSAGILEYPQANKEVVRAGITIYGIYPSDEVRKEPVPLTPVMQLKSHVSFLKEVEPGVQVSYGGTFETTRKTKIATIPVGYADGYPRQLSNKGWVLIRGHRAPILGRVCMDQFMVDVTDIPGVQDFDEAVLLGKSGESEIKVEELSDLSGRFPYEFVCDITKRVPRVYIRNGKFSEQKDFFDVY